MTNHSTEPRASRPPDRDRAVAIPMRQWKDVALRVRAQSGDDRIAMMSASVAFYAMLAIVPSLIAIVTLYGLVADPSDVRRQMESLSELLPEEARVLLEGQLSAIVGQPGRQLGLGLLASLAGALWASSGGMLALMRAVSVAHGTDEERSFVALRGRAMALTLGAIGFAMAVVAAIGVLPALFAFVGLRDEVRTLLVVARWPLLAVLAALALSLLYRYAPCRPPARWRWVTVGSALATVVWLATTGLFSVYVANFGSYNETYGALGGVVVLLLWLDLTAFAILIGAEIDAAIDHTARAPSATRAPEAMPTGALGESSA